ncbi:MAG: hypothetical protein ACJ8AT_03150 [Hyalangium sp.]|uniref:hypothetical protein n=1 Tax=Hyalangium sp. TaxID=2028555 RepID=UPI00389AC2F5
MLLVGLFLGSAALVASSRINVLLTGGSDVLTCPYRPALWAQMAALAVLMVCAWKVTKAVRLLPRVSWSLAGVLLFLPAPLTLLVGVNGERSVVQEKWGPFTLRTLQAAAEEGRLLARREGAFLQVEGGTGGPSWFFLGLSPWGIAGEIERHPLLVLPEVSPLAQCPGDPK